MSEQILLFSLIVALILLIFVSLKYLRLRMFFHSELALKYAELEHILTQEAEYKFNQWKEKALTDEAKALFEKWKQTTTEQIRKDAILRSAHVLIGKIGEQIAPLYLISELGVHPRDLKFIGAPIDFIAFKGLSEGYPDKIIFIEVKTSQSGTLSKRENMVRRLVQQKRVEWFTFNLRTKIDGAFKEVEKVTNSKPAPSLDSES